MAKKEKEEKAKVPAWISSIAKSVEEEGKALDMRAVSLTSTKNGIRWATSSNSLAIDLITGGGWAPGRAVSTFGPEQSGKTTAAYETIASGLAAGVPSIIFDAEQATDADYLNRIIEKTTGHSMDYYMGVIEDGKIVKSGLLYYIQPNTGENTFRMMNRIMASIPDVVKHSKKGWCWAEQGRTKNDYTLTPREVEGEISLLIVVDSLVALVPEAKEEDDTKNPIGMQARMFSNELPKTIQRCGRKRCTLLYTNQLRNKIGVMFGSPLTEPGGESPKFYSSQRLQFTACALSSVDSVFKTVGGEPEAKGQVDVEKSWNGDGNDKYRYSKIKVTKNKSFSPFQQCYVRWRFEKGGQQGDGLDPSFDTYMYLYMTGQCSKKTGKGLAISLLGVEEGESVPEKTLALLGKLDEKKKEKKEKKKDKKSKEPTTFEAKLTWQEFKELVENPERNRALIKHCKKQLKSGYAYALYFATKESDAAEEE